MVSGVQQYHMAQGVPPPYVALEESLLGTKLTITRNSKLVPPSTSHLPLREVVIAKKNMNQRPRPIISTPTYMPNFRRWIGD